MAKWKDDLRRGHNLPEDDDMDLNQIESDFDDEDDLRGGERTRKGRDR